MAPKKHADPSTSSASASAAPSSFSRRGGGDRPQRDINPDKIRDSDVAQTVRDEQEVRTGLTACKNKLRELQNTKEQMMRKLEPARDKMNDKIDGEFNTLLKKKDVVHRKMDDLRLERNKVEEARDMVKAAEFESQNLNREIQSLKAKAAELNTKLEALKTRRSELLTRLQYKTVSDADAEITKIEAKLAQALRKSDTPVVNALTKQKAGIERARKEVLQSYQLDEEIIGATDALKNAEAARAERVAKKEDFEKQRVQHKETIQKARSFGGEMDACRAELKEITAKLDAAKEKRKSFKPEGNEEMTKINEELSVLRTERDALQAKQEKLRASIPSKTFSYDVQFRGDIVGRGGATIQQLQEDFGVILEIDRDADGQVVVVGGEQDIEDAGGAITQMIENLALERKKIFMKVDPSKCGGIIGSRGSNIQHIQEVSRAKVDIDSKTGNITLTGNDEAINAAKKMIDEQLFNSAEMALKFEPDLRDMVYGKGGATVRKVEEESGVKKIRIDRENHLIVAYGTEDAVKKAKDIYTKLLSEMAATFTLRADDRMIRLIIGKGGATIQEIQSKSGAIINIKQEQNSVNIRGSKDAVDEARRLIEELTRREEIKIPFESHIYSALVAPLPEQSNDNEEEEGSNKDDSFKPRHLMDKVRMETGCDQVSAIRSEMKIVVRGKRECVNAARLRIEHVLRDLKPEVARFPFPEVVLSYLNRRTEDEDSILDDILNNAPESLISLNGDRRSGQVEVVGDKAAVAEVAPQIKKLQDDLCQNVRTEKVRDNQFGTVIGPQGRTISDLQRKHKVEINADRSKGEVSIFSPTGEGIEACWEEIKGLLAAPRAA